MSKGKLAGIIVGCTIAIILVVVAVSRPPTSTLEPSPTDTHPGETEEILISDSLQLEELAIHEVSFFVQSGTTIVIHVTAEHPIAFKASKCDFDVGGIGLYFHLKTGEGTGRYAYKWLKDCSLEKSDRGWLLEVISKVDESGYYKLRLMNHTGEFSSVQYVVTLKY